MGFPNPKFGILLALSAILQAGAAGVENQWMFTAGGSSSMIAGPDNSFRTWGKNSSGQLALADISDRNSPQLVNSENIREMDVGKTHGIALMYGSIMTWGSNQYGQLGDGTTNNRHEMGSLHPNHTNPDWLSACAGTNYSAGLLGNGSLYTWGRNNYGQLGLGAPSGNIYTQPTWVNISQVKAIACGDEYMMAIRADGTLWAWGYNGQGNLGNNSTTHRFSPIQVGLSNGTSTNWVSVSAGGAHSAGVRSGGRSYTWGYNANGQLGDNSTTRQLAPKQLTLPQSNHIVDIAVGGSHTLAVTVSGELWAWGANSSGQVGDNSTTQRLTPQSLTTDRHKWLAVKAGDNHSLAMRVDGTLMSWGSNSNGQLGRATNVTPNTRPGAVIGSMRLGNIAAISASQSFMIRSDGTLWTSGKREAALGKQGSFDNTVHTQINSTSPASSTVNDWVKLAHLTGGGPTFAIRAGGSLWAWGSESRGELGNGGGATDVFNIPTRIGAASDTLWMDVSCGGGHCLALKSNGTLWSWGTTYHGNQSTRTLAVSPIQVGSGTNWISASPGNGWTPQTDPNSGFTVALQANGTLWAWGVNDDGTLGQGDDYSTKPTPVQVSPGVQLWKDVTCGGSHVVALNGYGELFAWGSHGAGQLGLGEDTYGVIIKTGTPSFVPGGDHAWKQFSAYGANNVAVDVSNILWTWGERTNGQIGDGTVRGARPYVTPIITSRVGISAGWNSFSLDNYIYGWGTNFDGELGLGAANVNQLFAYPAYIMRPTP